MVGSRSQWGFAFLVLRLQWDAAVRWVYSLCNGMQLPQHARQRLSIFQSLFEEGGNETPMERIPDYQYHQKG